MNRMTTDPAALQRRVDAGDWLLVGEVATLLEISRSTAHRMVDAGTIGHRIRPGAGRRRECDPTDLRRLLDERRRVHRGSE